MCAPGRVSSSVSPVTIPFECIFDCFFSGIVAVSFLIRVFFFFFAFGANIVTRHGQHEQKKDYFVAMKLHIVCCCSNLSKNRHIIWIFYDC